MSIPLLTLLSQACCQDAQNDFQLALRAMGSAGIAERDVLASPGERHVGGGSVTGGLLAVPWYLDGQIRTYSDQNVPFFLAFEASVQLG